ncbi:ATP F0F1 synthase subunit B [Chelatococcus daeguensis]|uniref:ATP synthase subunit b n=2 Tax=Chelatococcus TaxID=28209 RepID=A0AAC9JRC8_9HYPH|nr:MULTISPECIES: ATP F0F1 synthase subunit B [Chelatococcus]APF36885.1 ATP F0F1 synthase subunit B [Chelatococcus daeguensis]KZE28068.1 ATP F0F1 synthase subunit B [Chelatococcus daeguensis]MBM3084642.1 ATP F0F1 synthase subunit B [Chelatococcus daeguensis]CUA88249.1 FoF1-type ATP synthase, membrane subunit b or b' [Chelatococcus sambhunathii]
MLQNTTFWVAVAFVIFFAIVLRAGAHKIAGKALDERGHRIKAELEEAARLRGEAEALLKEYEAKRQAAEAEAAAIVTSAREEAERVAKEAHERVAEFVARRTAAAEAKIAQAEAQAAAEVRAAAADAAVKAAEQILRDTVKGKLAEDIFAKGLGEVKGKLN